jgi:hypothetical protein
MPMPVNTGMKIAEILVEMNALAVRRPDQLDPNQRIDVGLLYRGVEGQTDAVKALRYFTGGDLGDGIYFTPDRRLAATYGGGPRASIRAETRVVHTYRLAHALYPEDVTFLFGGLRSGEGVSLFSGNGIRLWHGPWATPEMEQALKRGGRLVIGTPDSIGVNQIAVRDPSLVLPIQVGPITPGLTQPR